MRKLAEESGVPERTLWSWSQAFRKSGLTAFARKTRSDRGAPKQLKPELRKVIEGLALRRPAPSIAYVHRLEQLCTDKAWNCPSYRTVARTIQAIEPAAKLMAHEGTKAYGQAYDLVFRREAERPNEIWQSDHTPLDVYILDNKGGRRGRG
jgi:putative transposase